MTRARQWVWAAAGGFVALVAGFLALEMWIGRQVQYHTDQAVRLHPGSEMEALVAVMLDEKLPMRRRNLAVWALGQRGDQQALGVLRDQVTGKKCDHAVRLCESELAKAIGKLEREPALVPPPWRWAWLR